MLRARALLCATLLLGAAAPQGVASAAAADARAEPPRDGLGVKPALKAQVPTVLILTYRQRMQTVLGATDAELDTLFDRLEDLAAQVGGLIVDLGGVPDLADPADGLYALWDQASASASPPEEVSEWANHVLFGCHPHPETSQMHPWCPGETKGIHDVVLEHLTPKTDSLLLVGDDRILPMARLRDATDLLPETAYTEIDPNTSVGQAFAAGFFLSDDPLSVVDPVHAGDLDERLLVVVQLGTGRLVESVAEITAAVDNFLTYCCTPIQRHEVLVTGYDFLADSGKRIRDLWEAAICDAGTPCGVNSDLVGNIWNGRPWNEQDLNDHLEMGFEILNLNGHGTHYQLGVPGTTPTSITGLHVRYLYGSDGVAPFPFTGSVVYALGCHSGLSVPDTSRAQPLDLPQTLLNKGALAYVGNTGYGWGLKHGIGYAERLQEIFTDELILGGNVLVGELVKRTKLRFFLQELRIDPYSLKSLMQWTLYGFPFVEVQTGLRAVARPFDGPPPTAAEMASSPRVTVDNVEVTRELAGHACWDAGCPAESTPPVPPMPPLLTSQRLHFDLGDPESAYVKYDAEGEPLPAQTSGCPTMSPGCYFRLNGQVSGNAELPSLPTLAYDSRLSGTIQHGVLWRGGSFKVDDNFAFSHGIPHSNTLPIAGTVPLPEPIYIDPGDDRTSGGGTSAKSTREPGEAYSSVVVATAIETTYNGAPAAQLFLDAEIEVFYVDRGTAQDDWAGPAILGVGAVPLSDCSSSTENEIELAVAMLDPQEVWRVVVVLTDNILTGSEGSPGKEGSWQGLELAPVGGSNEWKVRKTFPCDVSRVHFFVQAVDHLGNVSWKEQILVGNSGMDIRIPEPIAVTFPP